MWAQLANDAAHLIEHARQRRYSFTLGLRHSQPESVPVRIRPVLEPRLTGRGKDHIPVLLHDVLRPVVQRRDWQVAQHAV